MLTSKHDSFHRKEVATVHICGHYYRLKGCSSFAEVEYIAASLPMMLVAVQVPMQCLLAMHCCSQCIALASKMAVDMPTKMFGTTNWQHLIH